MQERSCSIEYMNGKLIFDMPADGWGCVTLKDYIGDSELLIIPSVINYNGDSFYVESKVPDCAFSSCRKVKCIVIRVPGQYDDKPFRFGSCVFENCNNLEAIITLSKTPETINIFLDAYSFFHEVKTIHIVAGESWEAHRHLGDFYVPDPCEPEFAYCAERFAIAEQQCDFCESINNKLVDVVYAWFNNGNIDKLILSMRRFGGSEKIAILTNCYCSKIKQGDPIQLWTENVFKPFDYESLDLYP